MIMFDANREHLCHQIRVATAKRLQPTYERVLLRVPGDFS
jgi:hypothetical protein